MRNMKDNFKNRKNKIWMKHWQLKLLSGATHIYAHETLLYALTGDKDLWHKLKERLIGIHAQKIGFSQTGRKDVTSIFFLTNYFGHCTSWINQKGGEKDNANKLIQITITQY